MAAVNENTDKYRAAAYRMLIIETAVTAAVALSLWPGVGVEAAVSVATGGLAFIVPNAYFARYAFRYSAADSARDAVRWFYFGEVIKVVATVFIFTLAFLLVDGLNVAALILTYVALLILNLTGNAILVNR